VQAMAPAAHFGVERGDFGDDVHGHSLDALTGESYRIR